MAYTYSENLRKKVGFQDGSRGIYEQTISGTSLKENPVPENTAKDKENPILILQDPHTGRKIGISEERLALGLLALASAGGGKTNFFRALGESILENMGEQDILVIFDTKGDYYRTFEKRISVEDKVVLGTGAEYKNITRYPNLFAEIMCRDSNGNLIYTEEVEENVREIAGQMFSQMQSEIQPVYPAMAQQILEVLMIYMIRTYWKKAPSKLNNRELLNLIGRSCTADVERILNLEYMSDYRSCISYISAKSGKMGLGVMAYVSTVIRKILVGTFAKGDPAREFSMREIMTGGKKKVVFIEYDLQRGETLAPMYGLLLDQGLKYALGGREEKRKNVYFLMDEYILLPRLDYIGRGLSFGRSQGVKIIAGVQNIKALENIYGEAEAKNILSGFQNLFAFKMADHDTRQYVTDRLGTNYKSIAYSSQCTELHVQREGHVVEEWELQNLGSGKGKAVVELAGERPFFFNVPKYEDRSLPEHRIMV